MRTAELKNDFSAVAAALDQAEELAWERPGWPTAIMLSNIEALEAQLRQCQPKERDRQWLADRLERARANGWGEEDVAGIVRCMRVLRAA